MCVLIQIEFIDCTGEEAGGGGVGLQIVSRHLPAPPEATTFALRHRPAPPPTGLYERNPARLPTPTAHTQQLLKNHRGKVRSAKTPLTPSLLGLLR